MRQDENYDTKDPVIINLLLGRKEAALPDFHGHNFYIINVVWWPFKPMNCLTNVYVC